MKKNILLGFKDFLETYDDEEKKRLYFVLTALRGPDNDDMGTGKIKQVFTCKMRDAIGFNSLLSIFPRSDVKGLATQLKNAGEHWRWHTKEAIEQLKKANLIPPQYLKFFTRIEKLAKKQEVSKK